MALRQLKKSILFSSLLLRCYWSKTIKATRDVRYERFFFFWIFLLTKLKAIFYKKKASEWMAFNLVLECDRECAGIWEGKLKRNLSTFEDFFLVFMWKLWEIWGRKGKKNVENFKNIFLENFLKFFLQNFSKFPGKFLKVFMENLRKLS